MGEQCDDYDGYKKETNKEYTYKCGEVVWQSEIEMRKNLQCYDNAHSRAKCITEAYKKKIEEELDNCIETSRKPMCKILEDIFFDCMKREQSLYACNKEMIEFQECINSTVQDIYEKECQKRKSA